MMRVEIVIDDLELITIIGVLKGAMEILEGWQDGGDPFPELIIRLPAAHPALPGPKDVLGSVELAREAERAQPAADRVR